VSYCSLALVSLVALLACNGPVGLLPGGALEGEARPAPSDWTSAVGDYDTCQLETQPTDPYSVNIVCTVVEGRLYLNAGDTETQWVKNMGADPNVRLRVSGFLYELRAERVSDAAELATFGQAWTDQSMFRRDPRELEQVWVYRLVAR